MGAFDQQAAARFGAGNSALPWLAAQRDSARAQWLAGELPTAKTEAWKYTGLDALSEAAFLNAPEIPGDECAELALPAFCAERLVFVNGHYIEGRSSLPAQEGVCVTRFSEATDQQRTLISARLGRVAACNGNPFAMLAECWLNDGVLVHIKRGVRLHEPLAIMHVNMQSAQPFAHAQRLLLVAEEGAEAELIECFLGADGAPQSMVLGVSEFDLAPAARIVHCRLQLESAASVHIGGVYVALARDAFYRSFQFSLGSRLKRLDHRVEHLGEGSECRMDGVYLARGTQHVDTHSSVEHRAARGTTQQRYRGIIDEQARAVFNGRIHIHPDAQKCEAHLGNRNLLLSHRAEIDTKPELEIYADDVRCSHGATVSQIEDRALYYLRSRGIDPAEARLLLAMGFIEELIDGVGREELSTYLREVLRGWFGTVGHLERHVQ